MKKIIVISTKSVITSLGKGSKKVGYSREENIG